MPFALSRTDTGQFVLQDPRTDTVVIDDDLVAGLEKLEQIVADKPRSEAGAGVGAGPAAGPGPGSSAFGFRGGPRYAPMVLAVVLPFVWLAVLYFALANLLSEQVLGRGELRAAQDRVEALEGDVQALRSEIASAPRVGKSKAKKRKKPQVQGTSKPIPAVRVGDDAKIEAKTEPKRDAAAKPTGDTEKGAR